MKRFIIPLFQVTLLLTGIVLLFLIIRLPQTEGRAKDLDLFQIYTDPFLLYVFVSSIPFFVALFKGFRLLGFIGQHKLYSSEAAAALKGIKYCAILLSVLIVGAGLFILISHSKEDDPAGFLALCIVTAFMAVVVAAIAAKFEKKVQNTVINRPGKVLT